MIQELFGGWAIEWELFSHIISTLPKGSTILELGSGKGSAELNRYYHLYSVEHTEQFKDMYDTNYIYAPYNEPKDENSWYTFSQPIPRYDLLLIDGPDHSLRKNILNNLELFDWSKTVIIDDVQESDLLELGKKIANDVCRRPYVVKDGEIKKFMVIREIKA